MYVVLRQGSHQYRVQPGDTIQIEKIEAEKGQEVTLEDVLFLSNGDRSEIGEPRVGGVAVTAKVLRQGLGKKVEVFKSKRRKGYHKHYGHRQPFTEVRITGVSRNGQKLSD